MILDISIFFNTFSISYKFEQFLLKNYFIEIFKTFYTFI